MGNFRYNHIHDVIFLYTRTESWKWTKQHTEYDPEYVANFYRYTEPDGRRFRVSDLTASGTRRGSSGMPWRGIDPAAKGNHWKYKIEKLDQLDAEGRIYWPKKEGGIPGFKRYLDEMPGTALQSIWSDISAVWALHLTGVTRADGLFRCHLPRRVGSMAPVSPVFCPMWAAWVACNPLVGGHSV
jgi:hypothetical protein